MSYQSTQYRPPPLGTHIQRAIWQMRAAYSLCDDVGITTAMETILTKAASADSGDLTYGLLLDEMCRCEVSTSLRNYQPTKMLLDRLLYPQKGDHINTTMPQKSRDHRPPGTASRGEQTTSTLLEDDSLLVDDSNSSEWLFERNGEENSFFDSPVRQSGKADAKDDGESTGDATAGGSEGDTITTTTTTSSSDSATTVTTTGTDDVGTDDDSGDQPPTDDTLQTGETPRHSTDTFRVITANDTSKMLLLGDVVNDADSNLHRYIRDMSREIMEYVEWVLEAPSGSLEHKQLPWREFDTHRSLFYVRTFGAVCNHIAECVNRLEEAISKSDHHALDSYFGRPIPMGSLAHTPPSPTNLVGKHSRLHKAAMAVHRAFKLLMGGLPGYITRITVAERRSNNIIADSGSDFASSTWIPSFRERAVRKETTRFMRVIFNAIQDTVTDGIVTGVIRDGGKYTFLQPASIDAILRLCQNDAILAANVLSKVAFAIDRLTYPISDLASMIGSYEPVVDANPTTRVLNRFVKAFGGDAPRNFPTTPLRGFAPRFASFNGGHTGINDGDSGRDGDDDTGTGGDGGGGGDGNGSSLPPTRPSLYPDPRNDILAIQYRNSSRIGKNLYDIMFAPLGDRPEGAYEDTDKLTYLVYAHYLGRFIEEFPQIVFPPDARDSDGAETRRITKVVKDERKFFEAIPDRRAVRWDTLRAAAESSLVDLEYTKAPVISEDVIDRFVPAVMKLVDEQNLLLDRLRDQYQSYCSELKDRADEFASRDPRGDLIFARGELERLRHTFTTSVSVMGEEITRLFRIASASARHHEVVFAVNNVLNAFVYTSTNGADLVYRIGRAYSDFARIYTKTILDDIIVTRMTVRDQRDIIRGDLAKRGTRRISDDEKNFVSEFDAIYARIEEFSTLMGLLFTGEFDPSKEATEDQLLYMDCAHSIYYTHKRRIDAIYDSVREVTDANDDEDDATASSSSSGDEEDDPGVLGDDAGTEDEDDRMPEDDDV